ncbi:hypothetical protein C7M84_020461 [Penaeus vannamei]|uniref:Uncharacterized protein n=1 Tax=Penaeus vannamei TaxID=6689 RepID=A0A3R7MH73_PENVA|nr:hypothetical protein C7M84_020461 [Penaeus vannamei]
MVSEIICSWYPMPQHPISYDSRHRPKTDRHRTRPVRREYPLSLPPPSSVSLSLPSSVSLLIPSSLSFPLLSLGLPSSVPYPSFFSVLAYPSSAPFPHLHQTDAQLDVVMMQNRPFPAVFIKLITTPTNRRRMHFRPWTARALFASFLLPPLSSPLSPPSLPLLSLSGLSRRCGRGSAGLLSSLSRSLPPPLAGSVIFSSLPPDGALLVGVSLPLLPHSSPLSILLPSIALLRLRPHSSRLLPLAPPLCLSSLSLLPRPSLSSFLSSLPTPPLRSLIPLPLTSPLLSSDPARSFLVLSSPRSSLLPLALASSSPLPNGLSLAVPSLSLPVPPRHPLAPHSWCLSPRPPPPLNPSLSLSGSPAHPRQLSLSPAPPSRPPYSL